MAKGGKIEADPILSLGMVLSAVDFDLNRLIDPIGPGQILQSLGG